jgi:hypothetical protein
MLMKTLINTPKILFWIFLFIGITKIQLSDAQVFTFNTGQVMEDDNSKLKYGLQGIVKTQKDLKAGINTNNNQLSTFDNSLYTIQGDSLLIDAIAENEGVEMVKDLKKNNIKIIASYGKISTCWVSFDQLALFETIRTCRWVQPTLKPLLNSGNALTQGDFVQRSETARTLTGLNGSGVKVGVLSDSYNNTATATTGAAFGVSAGELPGIGNLNGLTTPVTVLQDLASGGSDEGRAMLEIIHDIAPNAQLYFNTAFLGKAAFASGITALANAGCKVIVDDVSNYDAAFFQDDVVAQAVNNVKSNQNVTYLSAAGNSSNKSYENSFKASSQSFNTEVIHNFAVGSNPELTAIPFTYTPTVDNGKVKIYMQWNQPFKSLGATGTTTDLNIYIAQLTANNTYSIFNLPNNLGRVDNTNIDPFEYIAGIAFNVTIPTTYYLIITKKGNGLNPSKLKFIYGPSIEFNTPLPSGLQSNTCFGHANADGAIAVGASYFFQTPMWNSTTYPVPLISPSSSYGGVPILFNQSGTPITPIIRNKPDIVAPDGGNTSFFGQQIGDGDTYPNFFGTSAAAPHAGAVAALMLQAKPTATPDDIKTALINSCTDMGTAGFDFITGNGFIKADAAILSLYSVSASVTNATQCRGINFSVNFSTVGTFGVGNIYKIQLSDATGSFSTPVDIGTLTSTANSGTITALIPIATATGSYKIRLVSSKPNKISPDISITIISVLAQPSAFTAAPPTICQGQNGVIYTVPTVAGATSYTWTYSGSGVPTTGTSNSITLNFSSTATSGTLSVVANNVCGASTARTLPIVVNPLPVQPDPFTSPIISVCQGQSAVTYSVPVVVGATSYVWTYTTGTGASFSSTTNTVSVNFSTIATSGSLNVVAVNACGQSLVPRSLSITVNPLPAQPGAFTTSTATVCQGQNAVTYTVPAVAGAASYTWIYSGFGVPITSTTNSITVNFSTTATSGMLSVVANIGACSGTGRTLVITVNPLPAQPGAFTTSTGTVCQGQNAVTYTVPTVAGATNYTWSYSGSGVSTTGTSNTITLNFSSTATSGTLSVVANNACGASIARTLAVIVTPLPVQPDPFTASSNTVCQGQTSVTYTVPSVAGATSYVWTYTTGTGASFTSTTNTVSVNFSASATSGSLNVVAVNACGQSLGPRSLAITVNPLPAQPGAFTTSTATVCQGQNAVTYTVPSVAGATSYTWNYSGFGVPITSTTNSITVNFSNTATSGTLSVVANIGVCSGTGRSLAITVNTPPTIPTSNQSGNWNNVSTWKCGVVPTIALDAIISAGNTITIDGVLVEIKNLVNNGGILNFLNNGSLKLNN